MYLVQKNHVRGLSKKEYTILNLLCRLSKNLYNVTNYTTREYYRINGKFLRYESAYHLVKTNENYGHMPSQVAQQTMKVVDRSYRSFFSTLAQKKKGDYDKPCNMPSFLPKEGYFVCIFPKDNFKVLDDGMLRLTLGQWVTKNLGVRYIHFRVPPHVLGHQIKEIRLLPRFKGKYFEIEYVYLQEPIPADLDTMKFMGVDLGLDNFATCTATNGTSFHTRRQWTQILQPLVEQAEGEAAIGLRPQQRQAGKENISAKSFSIPQDQRLLEPVGKLHHQAVHRWKDRKRRDRGTEGHQTAWSSRQKDQPALPKRSLLQVQAEASREVRVARHRVSRG